MMKISVLHIFIFQQRAKEIFIFLFIQKLQFSSLPENTQGVLLRLLPELEFRTEVENRVFRTRHLTCTFRSGLEE